MRVQVLGCSHHETALEIRERLAFSPDQTRFALDRLRRTFPGTEAVLLSTCNRVELYAATANGMSPTREQVADFLGRVHRLDPGEILAHLFERTDREAVRHLFLVASSLDSMVVGEPQILSQVKHAYQVAIQQSTTGPLTHAAFQTAVKVARRVANETAIHQHRVSIPSVAVADFARQIFERFDDKRILVIGAGEMAEETLRYLKDQGAADITVVNRSPQRAVELARRNNGRARPWEQLFNALTTADVVISTTGAQEPVVTLPQFSRIATGWDGRPLFILDLAVPRDFEPFDRQFSLGLPLLRRRPSRRLPAESPGAGQGVAPGHADHRPGDRPLPGRSPSSRGRPDHPSPSRRFSEAQGRRVAAAVPQATAA